MTITVKYFASLREAIGQDAETLELPADVNTPAALRKWLCARGEPWADALAAGRSVRVAVNFDMVASDSRIPEGAEVAFFPPVTGG